MRSAVAMLPGALLWGASFPLALAAAAGRDSESGRLVGSVYAANTGGAIIGALAFSLVVIPRIGTLRAQGLLIALCGLSAICVFLGHLWGRRMAYAALTVAATLGISAALAASLPPLPDDLIAYGRRFLTTKD